MPNTSVKVQFVLKTICHGLKGLCYAEEQLPVKTATGIAPINEVTDGNGKACNGKQSDPFSTIKVKTLKLSLTTKPELFTV